MCDYVVPSRNYYFGNILQCIPVSHVMSKQLQIFIFKAEIDDLLIFMINDFTYSNVTS